MSEKWGSSGKEAGERALISRRVTSFKKRKKMHGNHFQERGESDLT